ncbi:hypothetical protein MLD38_012558 [Melastoma candidum]|uniref:Uncharacterized protein n=1 Tax=Melastoma candidum TaxID=119954 RepID=A0ACB9R6A5_9MYRT|nr:hypothetical protein MLD38_012558 [Melastoma candidum]
MHSTAILTHPSFPPPSPSSTLILPPCGDPGPPSLLLLPAFFPTLSSASGPGMASPWPYCDVELGLLFGLWYLFNIYFNIYNKQVLKAFHYPATITVVQFAVGSVLVILMWAFNLYKRPNINASQLWAIVPLAVVHTLGNLFTNMSLSVSFTHTIKAMEAFFSVLLSALFLGEGWILECNGFQSYKSILKCSQQKSCGEERGFKFSPGYFELAAQKEMNVMQVLTRSLLAALCFHAYQQVSYMILQRVSPVTHSVGNCVKRVVVIVSSVLFFRTPVSPINSIGTGIALAGVFCTRG